jgi:hypothetical protein
MGRSSGKWIAIVSALSMLAAHAHAAVYDATADFQIASNPGAVWSYGYSSAGGAAYSVILFDDHAGTNAWTKSNYVSFGAPVAWKNNTGGTLNGVAAGQLSLHPGPLDHGDFAVLRFTAPRTATYGVIGQFFAGDSGSMSGRIVQNGDFGHPLQFVSDTTDTSHFNFTPISLGKGQTLDFVVGNNGSFFSGNTPLDVVVTDPPAVPESQTVAAFLIGIGLLILCMSGRDERAPISEKKW